MALAGCGRAGPAVQVADDVGRFGSRVISSGMDDAASGRKILQTSDELLNGQRTRSIELPVPPPVAEDPAAALRQRTQALLEPHAQDTTGEDLRRRLEAACYTNDLLELGLAPTPEAAVDQSIDIVLGELGDVALRERVRRLATDLQDAESSGDLTSQLAVFVACESTGEGP